MMKKKRRTEIKTKVNKTQEKMLFSAIMARGRKDGGNEGKGVA